MLYAIQYDGEDRYVEADTFGDAVAAWREDLIASFRATDCYEPSDEDVQPEQVRWVSEYPVIRADMLCGPTNDPGNINLVERLQHERDAARARADELTELLRDLHVEDADLLRHCGVGITTNRDLRRRFFDLMEDRHRCAS